MKKIYCLFLSFFLFHTVCAQIENKEIMFLRAKEMKSFASKMIEPNVNPNTLNYDLQYQRMDITLDPAIQYISGSVTSHFKPNQNINSIYFDLSNTLNVSEVKYHGINVNFQQLTTKELKINFLNTLVSNTLDSLTIYYSGAPTVGPYFAIAAPGNTPAPQLATHSQPFGAQEWFPTKQSLNDKIDRFDIKVTAPAQYSVASNGKLISETTLSSGNKLTFWRTMYPTAAYLIALSITDYIKINETIGNPPFPFVNYIYPSTFNKPDSMSNIEWTKQLMLLFESFLGPYPFRNEKYGHMEAGDDTANSGMEHQTMSTMAGWSKSLIAHELAHQWFGDKVTCSSWNDIWLNEGFATFGTHLANEKLIMTNDEFLNYLLVQKTSIVDETEDGSTYVTDANNEDDIFHPTFVYQKGGYIVRMIKWILGDDSFYQAIKDYHSNPNLAYKYASTSDLNTSLLQSTGKDFTEFFNDWVYGKGYPTYQIKWSQLNNNQIIFKISQTQSHPLVSFFEMPLPIKVKGTAGQVAYFKLNNSTNNQYFSENISFPVASVEFNYEYQILEKNSTVNQDNTLSTEDFNKENPLTLYPNPVKKELYIKGITNPLRYIIYSIDGKVVQKGIFQPKQSVSISKLSFGAYIFSIDNKKIKFLKN